MTRTFPLLDEIDDGVNADDVDWNQNAFQTLLTSNLPQTTVHYYALDVGLRRLESSLYETFWDVTIDALNDLSQFLFNIPVTDEISSYLYEAKCQLLMYASIALIKLHTIRRRVTSEARMSCAAICVLLLEQSRSYETPATKDQYSSCIRSMRLRYLKRTLIAGQWLPTLSRSQIDAIHSNHEQYIGMMIDELFSSLTLRKKINEFVDDWLLISDQGDESSTELAAASSGYVFIRRFPKYNEKTMEQHGDLMHLGLVHTLNHMSNGSLSKLFCCIWILACMVEADQVSLAAFDRCLPSERSSTEPIDFEQWPITADSLDRRDIIVFLLLCAQQNVRSPQGNSTLHPYLLYSSSSLCTQQQIHWWQATAQPASWAEFVDHLATMRLADGRVDEHPPKLVLLETAKILFTAAHTAYKQRSNRSASAYEQYAIQYLQTVKSAVRNRDSYAWLLSSESKPEKWFFFYPHKSMNQDDTINHKLAQRLIEQCQRLARQCDELKLLPQPPSPDTPSSGKEEKGFFISNILGADPMENESEQSPKCSEYMRIKTIDSPTLAKPFSNEHADVPDSATEQTSELPPCSSPPISIPPVGEAAGQPLAPLVDVIFSHMNSVNQWINRFHVDNEGLQNDIQTIRDRLERLNRATSHMIFSNVKLFQSNPDTDSEQPPPSSR